MPKVFVGEPAPKELAEIGPEAMPSAPGSWTRNEYRAYLLMRGVQNCTAPNALGDGGWRVATISVAARSGAYRVELARTGRDNEELPDRVEMVPGHRPARVALLVAAHESRA